MRNYDKNLFRLIGKRGFLWWSVRGSNSRHPGCDPGALPAELTDLIKFLMYDNTVNLIIQEPCSGQLDHNLWLSLHKCGDCLGCAQTLLVKVEQRLVIL